LLTGLAWIAIIMIPVLVASRQPVVSHNGYLNSYMDPNAPGDDSAGTSNQS